MRDLTEEELKLAPDWATHYVIYEFDVSPRCIGFYDLDWHQWVYVESESWSPKMTSQRVPPLARLIPERKPFDISKHDFSDWEISSADFEYGEFTLRFFEVNAIHLNKDDAIAIAKALGVTGEDLK